MSAAGRAAPDSALSRTREIVLPDEAATLALAAALAPDLARGDVVALFGDLGAGKTTFARGLLHARGYRGAVPSPTFTLVQQYDLPDLPVAHFDLYRLADAGELVELGLDDALHAGAALVEWPEVALADFPESRLEVHLRDDGAGRVARVEGRGVWAVRIAALDV